MIMAGSVLSQPATTTRASYAWARTTVSMESAMTSRETSEKRIPGVFWLIPSETEMVLKTLGENALSMSERSSAVAIGSWVIEQGLIPEPLLAMPTTGRLKSSSSRPIARIIARAGARSLPSLVTHERQSRRSGRTVSSSLRVVTSPRLTGRSGSSGRAPRTFAGVGTAW